MNKRRQSGFSIIEFLIILVILGLLAGVGWYAWNKRQDNQQKQAQTMVTSKQYTDTSKLYTLNYLSNWKVVEAPDCCEEGPKDYTKTSRSVEFVPPNPPIDSVGYGAAVQADATGQLASSIEENWKNNGHTPAKLTINGYEAEHVMTDFKGDAESYTDHAYLITHNDATIYITFREKYYHQYPPQNWSATQYLDDFTDMLNSIKFLN